MGDAFIADYTNLVGGAITFFQKIGWLSIPLIIVVVVVVNLFGGDRAIRAVGGTVAIVLALYLVLHNASSFAASLPH